VVITRVTEQLQEQAYRSCLALFEAVPILSVTLFQVRIKGGDHGSTKKASDPTEKKVNSAQPGRQ
jgi:hypothetical protein